MLDDQYPEVLSRKPDLARPARWRSHSGARAVLAAGTPLGSLYKGVASTPRLIPPASRPSRRLANMAATPRSGAIPGRAPASPSARSLVRVA